MRWRRIFPVVGAVSGLLAVGCADRDLLSNGGSGVLAGPRGLAACPTLRPLRPDVVSSKDRVCQAAIANAGTKYVASLLRAEHACADTNHPGPDVDGDPIHPCVGLRELSTGAYRLPSDEQTAAALRDAADDLEGAIREACDDAAVARLAVCSETVEGLVECLRADHWEAAQLLLREQYGDLRPIADEDALACRARVGAASVSLLESQARAIADCLLARSPSAEADGAQHCFGEVSSGMLVSPEDARTAATLNEASRVFRRAIRDACDDAHVPAVDSCGRDLASMEECLVCAHRREALSLAQSQFGGSPSPPETDFIDWRTLRNPVIGWDDRRIKDQVMAFHDGRFWVMGSIDFREDDPDRATKVPTYVHSGDWRTWEEFPLPEEVFESPDLTFHDGLWHVVSQKADPLVPENRRLVSTTTPDLRTWTPHVEIAPNVLEGRSIIDGALARWSGRTHLLLKWRVEDLPWIAVTSDDDLTAPWPIDGRLVAGTEQPFHGFAENGQFIEIDGRIRMLATARDPEGFRCGSVYTCSHEPFLYDFARGDGSAVEDWSRWRHKTQIRIPYEDWNPVMHANTGFLADWRAHDGFFYLSYSGSLDHETFAGRGHGKIGLARSRDLMHWRLPGDLRD